MIDPDAARALLVVPLFACTAAGMATYARAKAAANPQD